MADDVDVMGPVGYLVVEFPGNKMTGEGLPILVDLAERGLIRVLDLIFVMKDADGTVRPSDLGPRGHLAQKDSPQSSPRVRSSTTTRLPRGINSAPAKRALRI
jgi:hypothetical protein